MGRESSTHWSEDKRIKICYVKAKMGGGYQNVS
jgi:hypothetical protein